MQRLLSQIGRSQRLSILNLLKRSNDGMTVGQLADSLNMSYMGVKQQCLNLEKDGYLGTLRKHKGVGRPELLYHLTLKAHDLFPNADNSLSISLLNEAKRLFGPTAAEKILYLHFQSKAKDYASQLRGHTLLERSKSLTRLRENAGHMAEFEETDGLRIVERHNPLQELFVAYPVAENMEREMFEHILGAPIKRKTEITGGLFRCVFTISD